MILDRRLYKNIGVIKKVMNISQYVTKSFFKIFFSWNNNKTYEYPRDNFLYSPRFRFSANAIKCEKCSRPGNKVEMIIGGNTFNKVFVGECLHCHYFWPLNQDQEPKK